MLVAAVSACNITINMSTEKRIDIFPLPPQKEKGGDEKAGEQKDTLVRFDHDSETKLYTKKTWKLWKKHQKIINQDSQ